MLTMTGKVFVVAGGGSGIGEATAQTLATAASTAYTSTRPISKR
jgi:NAD(P)-dependent dehydrogenase (short-subunit alcohol dehydrogenase family)